MIKFLLGLLIFSTSIATWAESSSVYNCRFKGDEAKANFVRMKKYFDSQENMQMGKIDLVQIQNQEVLESTPTRVYQIPMLDNQTYVQLWNAKDVRVDAQLSYSQGGREFEANYVKGETKKTMTCKELQD